MAQYTVVVFSISRDGRWDGRWDGWSGPDVCHGRAPAVGPRRSGPGGRAPADGWAPRSWIDGWTIKWAVILNARSPRQDLNGCLDAIETDG